MEQISIRKQTREDRGKEKAVLEEALGRKYQKQARYNPAHTNWGFDF